MLHRLMYVPHPRQRHCMTRFLRMRQIPCSVRCLETVPLVIEWPQMDRSSDTHSHIEDALRDFRPMRIRGPIECPTGISLEPEDGPEVCHERFSTVSLEVDNQCHDAHYMTCGLLRLRERVVLKKLRCVVDRPIFSRRDTNVRYCMRLGWHMGMLCQ